VGGLLFLLPVLERLGFPTLLEQHPELLEARLPERVLASIARRLGASPEDAMLAVLEGGDSPGAREDADVRHLLLGWRVACRGWCRRAGLGLRELVCRPGRLLATPTHLDALFDMEHLDIRVRRLGLDVDPGWVPWLGRVVRFHYLRGEG
jgi:hypothetical protein